jgi:REP element-mobilizing transposase RayT
VAVHAYVLMTNHVHLLMTLSCHRPLWFRSCGVIC